jgi:hypothetical protein
MITMETTFILTIIFVSWKSTFHLLWCLETSILKIHASLKFILIHNIQKIPKEILRNCILKTDRGTLSFVLRHSIVCPSTFYRLSFDILSFVLRHSIVCPSTLYRLSKNLDKQWSIKHFIYSIKLKIEQHEPHKKLGLNSCASGGYRVPALLVKPVVLLILLKNRW